MSDCVRVCCEIFLLKNVAKCSDCNYYYDCYVIVVLQIILLLYNNKKHKKKKKKEQVGEGQQFTTKNGVESCWQGGFFLLLFFVCGERDGEKVKCLKNFCCHCVLGSHYRLVVVDITLYHSDFC